MPRVTYVKKSRKAFTAIDGSEIPVGSSYYYWKFRFGSIQRSLTRPKRSQLTRSAFLSQLYDIQDRIGGLSPDNGLESEVEGIRSELEQMRDECQDSLDNMPEQLQWASTSGELLQERIEALDIWISELESIDFDNNHENASIEDYDSELSVLYDDDDPAREEALEELRADAEQERWDEILEQVMETDSYYL